MKSKIPTNKQNGFTALIAVMMLSLSSLAFSLVTTAAAAMYADSILRRELRIQVSLNAEACAETAALMVAKDYFLKGEIKIREFGCIAEISKNASGTITINTRATLSGVDAYGSLIVERQSL